MRLSVIAALLCSSALAVADPVTQPSRCEVTYARVPEDIQRVIDAWVAAEQRCATSIDLRVIPTEGGLYLFARDLQGRIRERVVPDAQSAGVLVASWIADDSTPRTPMIVDEPVVLPPARPVLAAPGATAPLEMPAAIATVRAQPQRQARWLTLGAMIQTHGAGGGGLRGEVDLYRRGPWSVGLGLAGSQSLIEVWSTPGFVETTDLRAVGTLARTSMFGAWQLRLALGAGVVRTSAHGDVDGMSSSAAGVFPTAEASVMFGRELGGWAFVAGPVMHVYGQKLVLGTSENPYAIQMHRDAELMAFGAVRRRL